MIVTLWINDVDIWLGATRYPREIKETLSKGSIKDLLLRNQRDPK